MALQAEVGVLTGDGTGSQTVPLADSKITPKLVIIFGKGGSSATSHRWYWGASDGTNMFATGWSNAADGALDMDCHVTFDDTNTINRRSSTGTADAIGSAGSFAAGSFVMTWGTANTQTHNYLVLGGDDLLVAVGDALTPTVVGTPTTVTAGIAAKVVILVAVSQTAVSSTGADASWAGSIGVSTASGSDWCATTQDEDAAAIMDSRSRFNSARALQMVNDAGTVIKTCDAINFTATAFDVDQVNGDAVAYTFGWIALGGNALFDVGEFTQGDTDINFATAFAPSFVMVMGTEGITSNTSVATASWGFGAAASATQERAFAVVSESGGLIVDVADGVNTTGISKILATAADGTDAFLADVTSFDNDGFTLGISTDDAINRLFGYLAIGKPQRNYYLGGNAMQRGQRGMAWAA